MPPAPGRLRDGRGRARVGRASAFSGPVDDQHGVRHVQRQNALPHGPQRCCIAPVKGIVVKRIRDSDKGVEAVADPLGFPRTQGRKDQPLGLAQIRHQPRFTARTAHRNHTAIIQRAFEVQHLQGLQQGRQGRYLGHPVARQKRRRHRRSPSQRCRMGHGKLLPTFRLPGLERNHANPALVCKRHRLRKALRIAEALDIEPHGADPRVCSHGFNHIPQPHLRRSKRNSVARPGAAWSG